MPIFAPSSIKLPSLSLAYGPILQSLPILDETRCENASITVLSPISTSFKRVFGPIETLSPSFILPSKITFTSIIQSVPAEISPLTSILVGSDNVIPSSNRSSAFIFLNISSSSDNSFLVFAPFTSWFGTMHELILNPFLLIIDTISVK